jgi:hypothetical protein
MKRNVSCACLRSQRRNSCCCKRRFEEALQIARDLGDDFDQLDNLRAPLERVESPSPVLTLARDLLADHLRRVRTRWVAAIVAESRALADYLSWGGDR